VVSSISSTPSRVVLFFLFTYTLVSFVLLTYSKTPELKSFLKDGEAEFYENIKVDFIPGERAVLTIFHDGIEQEAISLYEYKTKDALHRLLHDKGFVLKNEEGQRAAVLAAIENKRMERLKHHQGIEYYRIRMRYLEEFRTLITQDYHAWENRPKMCGHAGQDDFIRDNYDKINKREAAFPKQLLDYANAYLAGATSSSS